MAREAGSRLGTGEDLDPASVVSDADKKAVIRALTEAYSGLSAAELRERQEFCYEAAVRMRDRFCAAEVWEALGMPVRECTQIMMHSPVQVEFRKALFSKIVPNLKRLGLLDAGDGWLRTRFGQLGVLEYEGWEDTGSEYARMDLDHAPWDVVRFQHY